ncbi:zinc-dependent alcohol dehydrogenase family protein [Dictyobacter kobayashii]|uniref:NADPH:quinone oxidoreductase n=1 Tax=Dictyobacter kobayashii TaxID=2014872 RepID=A0A402AEI7_9CHLR|nr:NAD(P)-dependent alcohol dehydrogenase [Dictyobacter kobayashii]GCE17537.1 NADPH:quinone oxidoreductase [Dictyobacter kobayashii]
MRAFEIQQHADGNKLVQVEREQPQAGPGEILIRVHAASLNYRDLLIYQEYAQVRPLVPLSDGAGEVVAVGDGVRKFKVGDRVVPDFFPRWVAGEPTSEALASALGGGTVNGMASEYIALPADGVLAIPDYLSYEEAATLPCAAVTAWSSLVIHGKLRQGETVLALGTGGVSIFALQIAKIFGARVIITSHSDEKLARARQLGADYTINYKTTPHWAERVLEITNGQGADHVVEVGGAGTLPQSLEAVREGGHISLIGLLTGEHGTADQSIAARKKLRIEGIYVGSCEMFEEMNLAFTQHQVKPVIDKVFPFSAMNEAYQYLKSGVHFGKVVVNYQG